MLPEQQQQQQHHPAGRHHKQKEAEKGSRVPCVKLPCRHPSIAIDLTSGGHSVPHVDKHITDHVWWYCRENQLRRSTHFQVCFVSSKPEERLHTPPHFLNVHA